MAEPNYKVAVALYGKYPHGSIIPAAVPLAYGSQPAELVRMGTLVPTHEPCNCPILADDPEPRGDALAELVADRNRWQERATRAERAEQLLMAQVEGLQRDLAARDAGLQKAVVEQAKLEARVADLTNTLEELTGPAKAA